MAGESPPKAIDGYIDGYKETMMLRMPLTPIILVILTLSSAVAQGADEGVESLREIGKAFSSVARAVSPSVVFIQAETKSIG